MTVSTRQNLDLVCDIATEGWWPCHLTVEMQIPSTLRTIIKEERSQDWSVSVFDIWMISYPNISNGFVIQRVVADAGAYFALIQFFSWIASGMAWM